MSAIVVQLADALVARLQASEWSGVPFAVRRTYADCSDETLATDRGEVDVAVLVPEGYESVELDTRTSVERTAIVTVVLRKKFLPDDYDEVTGTVADARVDELISLTESLSQAAIYERLAEFEEARFVPPVEHDPIYRRDHLRELRQFTSVFQVTFAINSEL